MPSAPHGLAGLLCFVSNPVISMRTRAATAWLDDMPSHVRKASESQTGRLATESANPRQCFWNNATDLCMAYMYVRPEGASSSPCEPWEVDYPRHRGRAAGGMTESTCKATTGKHGACYWDSEYSICYEPLCSYMGDSASCQANPNGCQWDAEYKWCSNIYCYDRKDAADCSLGTCEWTGSHCQDIYCSSFLNTSSCSAGSSKITKSPEDSRHDLEPKCYWEEDRCKQGRGCDTYSEAACATDPANFGGCQWNTRVNQCLNINTCDDYESEASCQADPFAVADKSVGATCFWKTEPLFTVGTILSMGLFGTKVNTSQNLKIKSDHTLTTMNEGESWELRQILKLEQDWSEREVPIQAVLDTSDQQVDFNDVPTPIPDGFKLVMASCKDDLPIPLSGIAWDKRTACNHHDMSTCATATTLYPCPSYCGWASCWVTACSESCSFC